jgi:hypothetical protein
MNRIKTPEEMRLQEGEGVPHRDWKDMPDGKEKYQHYLQSREWAEKRNAVKERCGGVCERCNLNLVGNTHHLTYERKYNERLEDLAGWCQGCHDFTHGHSDVDPLAEQEKYVDSLYLKDVALKHSLDDCGSGRKDMLPAVSATGMSVVRCPRCKCENVHFYPPRFEAGNDNYDADWDMRGNLIVIPCWGECPHVWELCIGFHKGTTFAFTRRCKEDPRIGEGCDA